MKIKRSRVAAAITAAVALGSAGQALASVYAGAYTFVSDLNLQVYNETTFDTTGITLGDFTFTANSNADLNGSTDIQNATCSTIGTACTGPAPVLQSAANGGGGTATRSGGDFSLFGPGSDTYANSGAEIGDAELVTGSPTDARQIAEAEIQGSGFGTGGTTVSSQTAFKFDFSVTDPDGPGALTLSFNADPYLRVFVDTLNLVGALAQASISATFSLVNADESVNVSWTPSGGSTTGFSSCEGVGSCTENADGADLTRTLTLPAGNPQDLAYSLASGLNAFGISISGIPTGSYSVGLTLTSFVRAEQTVPEPGMLSLLGIGLLGLGTSRRKRLSKQ